MSAKNPSSPSMGRTNRRGAGEGPRGGRLGESEDGGGDEEKECGEDLHCDRRDEREK